MTRGFTAPRNDQLFLLEFRRRISSSLIAIRGGCARFGGRQATARAQSVPDVLSLALIGNASGKQSVAPRGDRGGIFLYKLDGSKPVALASTLDSEYPVRFVNGGKWLLVSEATGHHELVLTVVDLANTIGHLGSVSKQMRRTAHSCLL